VIERAFQKANGEIENSPSHPRRSLFEERTYRWK
jgi:hypothetical protein